MKKFRNAYVLKPGMGLKILEELCEEVIYPINGFGDHVDNIRDSLDKCFDEFDSVEDVLVPTGGAYINMIAGSILARKLLLKDPAGKIIYNIAIWLEGKYIFWRITPDPAEESYQLL